MSKFLNWARCFYDRVVLEHPAIVILCLLVIVSFLGYRAKDFKLDASTETLIIETDEDLRYSRLISARYGGYDYLLVTYSPRDDLFSDQSLATLSRLRDELKALDTVMSVTSILDAPLLESPPVPVKELVSHIQTLETPSVDRKLARIEFKESPLYRDLLVSPDLKTTGLQIRFKADENYQELLARRDVLQEKQAAKTLTNAEAAEFKDVKEQILQYREKRRKIRHEDIAAVRAIIDKYRKDAQIFLGGVSIITDDMIRFIQNDLRKFGLGVAFFLIVTLGFIFRRKRWVFLPMLCCVFSAISMMGLLGLFGWKVTVISSNFISLQLIITMAVTIHLIVRYRELLRTHPEKDQRQLILATVSLMLTPCLYAGLTTIAGFGSLLLCDILPVRSFGWMMSAGIVVSLTVTFLFFPAALMLMRKIPPHTRSEKGLSLTAALARFTVARGTLILVVSVVVFIISAIGISRLKVENSFINYFKKSTEIHQGMKVIDQKLGGTTPMDIIIDVVEPKDSSARTAAEPAAAGDDEFEEFDEFNKADDEKYWFTAEKMALVTRVHDYLESQPEIGKVMSLGTMLKVAEKLNDGKPLDNFQLALVYAELPEKFKNIILKPYVSPRHNQLRYSIRVKDSEKTLRRDALIKRIRHDLVNKLGLEKKQIHLTGLLVLYNNMLQSLFKSQILTLGVVVLVLLGMFWVLFRSLKTALIALAPNLLAICVVLGFIGWSNIPLDMMTITIAAISMGMAVDNTIHYIYRFRYEFNMAGGRYREIIHRCHGSIGRALYYTSLTIIVGFSILALSNFIPTIYFGLLTGLAMFIALIAALTLLPQLIIIFRPFGTKPGINRN